MHHSIIPYWGIKRMLLVSIMNKMDEKREDQKKTHYGRIEWISTAEKSKVECDYKEDKID